MHLYLSAQQWWAVLTVNFATPRERWGVLIVTPQSKRVRTERRVML
jgi:hypothetical protein